MNLNEVKYSEAPTPDEALHWAIEMLDFDGVELMLMNGVDPNARSAYGGETALQHAIDSEADAAIQNDWAVMPIKITALLLAFGADPREKDKRGEDALHWAAGRHRQALALMQRLLGVDSQYVLAPNGTTRDQRETPTWLMPRGRGEDIVRCDFCQGTFEREQVWHGDLANICPWCIHQCKSASDGVGRPGR